MISLLALRVALFSDKSVFVLVLDAWAVLGAGFAPLLTVYALGRRPSEAHSIAMMLGGIVMVYAWPLLMPGLIYAIAPGITSGVIIYLIGSRLGMVHAGIREEAASV